MLKRLRFQNPTSQGSSGFRMNRVQDPSLLQHQETQVEAEECGPKLGGTFRVRRLHPCLTLDLWEPLCAISATKITSGSVLKKEIVMSIEEWDT